MSMVLSILESTLRLSTPLIFAALGGLMSERAGVVNIALEGKMLLGAFFAAVFAVAFQSPWIGWWGAFFVGGAVGALYGFFVIYLRSDQIVAGTAFNFLAAGVAPFGSKILYGSTGGTPSLDLENRFSALPMFWVLLLGLLIAWWDRYSRSALWHQFAGEHPQALSSAGVNVERTRWCGVILSGAFAAWGGASLSIFLSSSYSREMTAGRGFMALAALILGKWKPLPTLVACLFFGLADALQIRLQGVKLVGEQPLPVQLIQILPYLVTVVVLAGWVGRSRAPRALGIPFEKA